MKMNQVQDYATEMLKSLWKLQIWLEKSEYTLLLFQKKKNPSLFQELTTATKKAAFKFPQASQQAFVVKKGNHLLTKILKKGGQTNKISKESIVFSVTYTEGVFHNAPCLI